MHWLTQTAERLRDWLSQQAWLEPVQPLINPAPDWVLLSAGPLVLALLVVAATALTQRRRGKRQSHPNNETGLTTRATATPEGVKTRVFLSYSRNDADFTGRLETALSAKGYVVDFDRSTSDPDNVEFGISAEDEWWKRLQAMIAAADTMVFVASPDSAASKVCDEEIGYARALGKRIVPILLRPIDFSTAPPRLAALNVKLSFVEKREFNQALDALVDALDLDIAWHREGARLTSLAAKWDQDGRTDAHLLSEGGVANARAWAVRRPPTAPHPGELAVQFIDASDAKARGDRDRLLANIGRAYVKPAEQALADGRHDAALRLAAAGVILSEDCSMRLAPERARSALLAASEARVLMVLHGHGDKVQSAAFSADGGRIVTGSSDKTARIWDAESGREIAVLRGHEGRVRSAAFCASGARIVTASQDKTSRIWDARGGLERLALRGHGGEVTHAVFSPDGARVVTSSEDKLVRMWNASDGRELAIVSGHDDIVRSAVFSPDGARILTASDDKTARIWDAESGRQLISLQTLAKSAVFSGDGKLVATASGETARIWDAESGNELGKLLGHAAAVQSVAFSADSARIVTSSSDNTVRVWDVQTGREIAVLRGQQSAENAEVVVNAETAYALAANEYERAAWGGDDQTIWSAGFSPDGARIVTGAADGTARVWAAYTGRELARLNSHEKRVKSVTFSPDGTNALTTSEDKTARVWDCRTGGEVALLRHLSPIETAEFSPDGALIVTASQDGVARLWEASTGREIIALQGHTGWIWSACFSADGARIVTGSSDKTARVWDVSSGRQLTIMSGHEEGLRSAVFSADGATILTAGDKTARVWDARTGREIAALRHFGYVHRASFSPGDGARIVTCAADAAHIWETGAGREIAELRHKGAVGWAGFSPDGERVLTASQDGTARLWDARTGRELTVLRGHSGDIWSAGFSADGARILTAAEDKTACIWDAEHGHALAILSGCSRGAISADGARVATASNDNMARIWDIAATAALAGDIAEVMAAVLTNGRGLRTRRERADTLMQAINDEDDDLGAALVRRLEKMRPGAGARVSARSVALARPLHPNCYLSPTQFSKKFGLDPPVRQ